MSDITNFLTAAQRKRAERNMSIVNDYQDLYHDPRRLPVKDIYDILSERYALNTAQLYAIVKKFSK